jgi:GNAT superfamily N-acetyltransferase
MSPNYITELFDSRQHQIRDFQCGISELDRYIRERAGQESRKKVTTVYVLREQASPRVLGYYTLSSCSIELINLTEDMRRKLPRYEALPAALIGRLAVDMIVQGKGIGEHLLIDAFTRSYTISKQMAIYAVIVEAKDDNSRNFYEKYGFIRALGQPLKLYLPMGTIEKLILS